MGAPAGSELTQIARFVETALTVIRAAHDRDADLVARCMHQLNNIAGGWTLSIELAERAEVRSMQLEFDSQED